MRPICRAAAALAIAHLAVPVVLTAQDERETLKNLMISEFERSYVAIGPTNLVFEGSVAPPFFLTIAKWHTVVVFTPKVVLRMYDTTSSPVRTPSYMPRGTVYWFKSTQATRGVEHPHAAYVSLTVSHHSNGQEGPEFNPDGSVNHLTGNFSTNFIELAHGSGWLPRLVPLAPVKFAFSHLHVAAEGYIGGMTQMANAKQFSRLRFRVGSSYEWDVNKPDAVCRATGFLRFDGCIRDAHVGWKLTWLTGSVAPEFQGVGRFPISVTAGFTPTGWRELGFFAEYYSGQDYYNTYFDQTFRTIRVGVRANRGLTR